MYFHFTTYGNFLQYLRLYLPLIYLDLNALLYLHNHLLYAKSLDFLITKITVHQHSMRLILYTLSCIMNYDIKMRNGHKPLRTYFLHNHPL